MVDAIQKFQCETTKVEEKSSFQIEWKIHKEVIEEFRNEKNGRRQSTPFLSHFYNSTWVVSLSKATLTDHPMYFSLELKNAAIDLENIWIKYHFTLKNQIAGKDFSVDRNIWIDGNNIKSNGLLIYEDKISDFVFINNYMIITYDVSVKVIGKESLLLSPPLKSSIPTLQDTLAQKYLKLLNSGLHSDVILKIGNENFKAHKSILASNCEYFEAMFGDGFKESADKVVEIKDVNPRIFKVILEFIYTNRLPSDLGPIVKELLAAADKILLSPLVKKCEEKLSEIISVENCVELLILADSFNQGDLKTKLISFIKYNVKQVVRSEAWKELKKTDNGLALEAIEGVVA